jgi:hypothetical protein
MGNLGGNNSKLIVKIGRILKLTIHNMDTEDYNILSGILDRYGIPSTFEKVSGTSPYKS